MKILKKGILSRVCLSLMLMCALVLGCMGNQYGAENKGKASTEKVSVVYNTHIQNIGWEKDFSKKDGQTAGTTGKSLRLEGVKIKLNNLSGVSIKYQTHVQNIGWQDWKKDGKMAGTSGKSLRLEGIKIKLENTDKYSVMYRVHVQNIGWQDWKKDGQMAGTQGQSLRLEAIEIKIVEKVVDTQPHVEYRTHVQNIGWQGYVRDGKMAGTTGKSYRVEALKVNIVNLPAGTSLKYQTHIQDIGWQNWKQNNQIAGTEGKSLRLEAIKIKLEGTDTYSIMYRTHVQDIGWQNWCYDGEMSGTQGLSKRVEAIEIKIVPKIKETKIEMALDKDIKSVTQTNQKISGWVMSNLDNVKLKILIDNKEIDTTTLKRKARQDILNYKKGFGDESKYNKTPGFEINIDFSKYSLGDHNLTIQAISKDKVVKEIKRTIKVRKEISHSKGTYGVSGLKVKGDSRGSNLPYYQYGSGPNVFYATFAIHGFEDLWSKDGTELVNIANNFYQKLLDSDDYTIPEKWTIYIFPGVNQDGLKYGTTNNGPGRTTLFSEVPSRKGIDMNRCWQVGNTYKTFTDSRNYNGTTGFQAYEAKYLRNFLINHKSKTGKTVLVDLHGWTQQLIGDSGICSYYRQQFPENDGSAIGRYGTGYLINWARSTLGARSALIELPNNGVNGHQAVINKNFSDRYINATLQMLKNI